VRVISNAVKDADRSRWKIADALAVLSDAVPRWFRRCATLRHAFRKPIP
jgi:hypothetical protein